MASPKKKSQDNAEYSPVAEVAVETTDEKPKEKSVPIVTVWGGKKVIRREMTAEEVKTSADIAAGILKKRADA